MRSSCAAEHARRFTHPPLSAAPSSQQAQALNALTTHGGARRRPARAPPLKSGTAAGPQPLPRPSRCARRRTPPGAGADARRAAHAVGARARWPRRPRRPRPRARRAGRPQPALPAQRIKTLASAVYAPPPLPSPSQAASTAPSSQRSSAPTPAAPAPVSAPASSAKQRRRAVAARRMRTQRQQ